MPARIALCKRRSRELLNEQRMTAPPVDVEKIAGSQFLQIDRSGRGEHRGRAMLSDGTISLNAGDAPTAQRFSIAHELGHYVLRHDGFTFSPHEERESDLYAEDPMREEEREADHFASTLLMPPQWLRRDAKAGRTLRELAALYRVSVEAMIIALERRRLRVRG